MDAVDKTGTEPRLPAGLPEGWVLDRDLPCPKCRYNLRMLSTPRCPECGTVFRWQTLLHITCPRCGEPLGAADGASCPRCHLRLNWRALLEEGVALDRGLYEYSGRPAFAAIRTRFALLLPRRFWRRLPLESPPMTERLERYQRTSWLIAVVGCVIALVNARTRLHPLPWIIVWSFALGPWAITRGALPRFTPTLTRFAIRRDQLQRCLAYGSTGLAWIGLVCGLTILTTFLFGPSLRRVSLFDFPRALRYLLGTSWGWRVPSFWVDAVVGAVYLHAVTAWWWRFLYVTLRDYLRLDLTNALALLISTQVIAILLVLLLIAGLTIISYYLGLL